jgi:hypothetical protein
MLVHEVMSTGLVTAQKTDTVRSVVMKIMNRHCAPSAPYSDSTRRRSLAP